MSAGESESNVQQVWNIAWTVAEFVEHHERVRMLEDDGARFVLKTPRRGESLNHEVTVLTRAAELETNDRHAVVDRPVHVDTDLLVLEVDPRTESLHDQLTARWTLAPLAGVGRSLATVHGAHNLDGLPDARPERPQFFPLTPTQFAAMPIGTVQLLRSLDQYPTTRTLVESISERTTHTKTMVHGDCKPDNIRFCLANGTIRFIDWELGGIGDPLEDLAGAMGALIAVSVQSRMSTAKTTSADIRLALTEGTNRAWEAISTMLSAYLKAGGDISDPEDLILLTALKLICRAQVQAALAGKVGTTAYLLLQAAVSISENRARVVSILPSAR